MQCSDLRSDQTFRNTALANNDTKILAIVSRELVAAKACYHRSCYRKSLYTPIEGVRHLCWPREDNKYKIAKSTAHELKLFDYIRPNILDNPQLVKFTEISQQMVLFMQDLGAKVIKEFTKKTHFCRHFFNRKIFLKQTVHNSRKRQVQYLTLVGKDSCSSLRRPRYRLAFPC